MGQKIVSFEVAKALKEAGYPQDYKNVVEDTYLDLNSCVWAVKPTYDDVLLWLWREKQIYYGIDYERDLKLWFCWVKGTERFSASDTEEAIESAINYLVENNMIK